jgi:hypothetical protein
VHRVPRFPAQVHGLRRCASVRNSRRRSGSSL